jgi:hypothetical protein
MSMFYNNLKITTVINLKTHQKKDLNSIKPNRKRRKSNNKKLHLKDFASYANKFWLIKYKKFKSVKDLMNHHAP